MTTIARNHQPIDAFITRKADIDTMLERLAELSDDHFNVHPDEITRGHVGTLEEHAELRKRITDSTFKEGEHTE